MKKFITSVVALLCSLPLMAAPEARDLIRGAIDQWRGKSSHLIQTMVIHRPDWERRVTMVSVTRGEKDALVRFTAPPKNAGNATLKLNRDMWIFTPRLNHVTKLPSSMMAQSWMGSDFSYDDLAKSDSILDDYRFTLVNEMAKKSHTIYTVQGIPKKNAAVVWGKEVFAIREDFVMLERSFYDQDMQLVRRMLTVDIAPVYGRDYPVKLRMETLEKPAQWTLVQTEGGRFNIKVPDFLFTLSNLRNPRDWRPR